MTPLFPFVGDSRHHTRPEPHPDWLLRDLGERAFPMRPARVWRLKLPIWPGFRLEINLHKAGGQYV